MKYLEKFEVISNITNRESKTRTKSISEDEFLEILRDKCKNFSFSNDLLWRGTDNHFGDFGMFLEKERIRNIGNYTYHTFFDLRKDYPVPRYKSLIGSTEKFGAEYLSSCSNVYLVIPFDESQMVFSGTPDLALWARKKVEFTDDLFIMKEYNKGFKVPKELEEIRDRFDTPYKLNGIQLGYEFFTTSPCILLKESKVDWLMKKI